MYKYVLDKVFQGKWRFRYHTPYFLDQLVLVKLILFKTFLVFIPPFQRKFITYLFHKESAKTQAEKYKDITTMKSQKNKLNRIIKRKGERNKTIFSWSVWVVIKGDPKPISGSEATALVLATYDQIFGHHQTTKYLIKVYFFYKNW